MDWSAVALLIAEQAGLPALVLSSQGEVLMVTPAAAQAFGVGFENVGANWIERQVVAAAVGSARWYLEKALAGALRKLEIPVVTARGAALACFDARPFGHDDDRGLLLVLERLTQITREETAPEYDYEVTGVETGRMLLKKLWRPGFEATPGEGSCFQALHGRSTPCDHCPLLRSKAERRPGVVVRSRPPHDYLVTSATELADDTARISVRSLSMASLAAVLQAKLDDLAARARLSKRERSVFGHLMDGSGVDEIASALEISPRTVKFHQANVLQKLGADSRADLMRLVF
jgi:DNA-binding CsgD family transcriptional regulator